jgi:hypothetical protein
MLQDKSFKSCEDKLEEEVRELRNLALALLDIVNHQNEEMKGSIRSDVSTIANSYKNKSFKSCEDKLEEDARELHNSARALLYKAKHQNEEMKGSIRSDVAADLRSSSAIKPTKKKRTFKYVPFFMSSFFSCN